MSRSATGQLLRERWRRGAHQVTVEPRSCVHPGIEVALNAEIVVPVRSDRDATWLDALEHCDGGAFLDQILVRHPASEEAIDVDIAIKKRRIARAQLPEERIEVL